MRTNSRMSRIAVGISVVCQMSMAGCMGCFPLYSLQLRHALSLNLKQLNSIYVIAGGAQYISASFAGAIGDKRGPALLSFIAAVLFAVGYGLMSLSLSRAMKGQNPAPVHPSTLSRVTDYVLSDWLFIASYFALTGIATTFAYFSSLTTACKTWPNQSGLAIGLPSALFGLSPLFLSQIAYLFFTSKQGSDLDAVRYLYFLAISAGIVNLLCAVTFHIFSPTPTTPHETDETSALLPPKAEAESTSLSTFIKSRAAQQLATIFFLSVGPIEMLSASLGSIVESLLSSPSDTHPIRALSLRTSLVQVMALCNTVVRIAVGGLSDLICPTPATEGKKRVSRLWLFSGMSGIFAAVLLSAVKMKGVGHLYVLCLVAGAGNGLFSTLVPGMTANKFGQKDFGRNWGILAQFAGVSGSLFNELYALLSDREGRHQGHSSLCAGSSCYSSIMVISALSVGCAAVLSLWMSRGAKWKRV